MLENGDRYALRGTEAMIGYDYFSPSEYKIDASFNKAPKSFLPFAKVIWARFCFYKTNFKTSKFNKTMNQVLFSPGTDCLNAIVDNIRNAKKTVKICVFTISDNRIVSAIESLKYKDVEVRIITDNDKRFDRGSDIIYLNEKGYNIKVDLTDAHMHHKFAVIDDKITITGSYNWTRSAEKYNQENILITDNNEITEAYSKEFEKLWNNMKKL